MTDLTGIRPFICPPAAIPVTTIVIMEDVKQCYT